MSIQFKQEHSISNTNANNSNTDNANQNQPKNILQIADMTVEQILHTWEQDLESHISDYLQHAVKIRHWDQKLLTNSSKIIDLQKDVTRLTGTQSNLNSSLEKVRGQQKNQTTIIEELERALGIGLKDENINLNNVSDHRQVYQSAESVDQNLNNLNQRLQTRIQELSQNTEQHRNDAHPLTPAVTILNAHMESLNWVDTKCQQLTDQIAKIQNVMQ